MRTSKEERLTRDVAAFREEYDDGRQDGHCLKVIRRAAEQGRVDRSLYRECRRLTYLGQKYGWTEVRGCDPQYERFDIIERFLNEWYNARVADPAVAWELAEAEGKLRNE